MSEIRVSEIRVSKIRGSEIRGSEIRGSKIRVSEIRVSKIRISSNHRELHGAIFLIKEGNSKQKTTTPETSYAAMSAIFNKCIKNKKLLPA